MCIIEWGVGETYLHYIHLFIVNPEGSMVQQYSTINHLNTHVHDSEATLARHVARFDAIATCHKLWQRDALAVTEQAVRWALHRV